MTDKSFNREELQELKRRLQKRRSFLNLTYKQLADKTGMNKSTLQRYEKGGIKNIPYDKIVVLAEALEVPVNYFIDLDQDFTFSANMKEEDDTSDSTHIRPELNYRKNNISSPEARKRVYELAKEFKLLALGRIAPVLLQAGYGIDSNYNDSLGDIVATKGKEIWHIEIRYIRDFDDSPKYFMVSHNFLMLMGRLATYKGRVTKYSVLFNIDGIGDELLQKYSPQHLNVDVSLLYLTDGGYREAFFEK